MILNMSSKLYPGFESHSLGNVFEDATVTAFFGHRGADPEALGRAFPDYTLSILKQTHSDRIVSAATVIRSGDPIDADAQITDEKRIALCIRTADCVPVLIHDRDSGLIAAVHAGWRGLANGIIVKTGQMLKSKGPSLERAHAWIGPHIGRESFEVGEDVAALLEIAFDAVRGFSSEQTSVLRQPGVEKPHVDLLRIVRAQLGSIGISRDRTTEFTLDTVSSTRHESFRRDREKGGRQVSFIALK
jgi:YfiH family protein